MLNEKQNIEAMEDLLLTLRHAERGFYLFTAPSAQAVTQVAHAAAAQYAKHMPVLDFAEAPDTTVSLQTFLAFAARHGDGPLVILNMQAASMGAQDETMQALNMLRDALASLRRVWVWGVTTDFRWAMQRQAKDMYAYLRSFTEFAPEPTLFASELQADEPTGYAADYVKKRAEVRRVQEAFARGGLSAAQRLALLISGIEAWVEGGLPGNEELRGWVDECEKLAEETASDLQRAMLYVSASNAYEYLGDYLQATAVLRRAVAIRESVLGLEHPDTATTYNNLAGLYRHQGDYAQALSFCQKALAISEKVLGLEHPDTAATYNNLAGLYESQGDYAQALSFFQKAVAICEEAFGLEHPTTVTTYHNLAELHKSQGDYAQALSFYQKALAISEKVLGLEHPTTATIYNNLAGLYKNQGDDAQAIAFYQKSLDISEKALGLEHPTTATIYNNLALQYKIQGDYAQALLLYQKALAIREKVLGLEHPDTAMIYNWLVSLFYEMHRYNDARAYAIKAYDAFKKNFGPNHENTMASQAWLNFLKYRIYRKKRMH